MKTWLIIPVMNTTWAVVKLKPVSHDLCDTGAVLYQLSYDTISSGLNLFQALMSQLLKVVCITAMTNHVSIYFSEVQIHDLSYIYLHYSPSTTHSQMWPSPRWIDSSVGRALHQYRRGHGFKSHSGLNFFSGLNFTTA